MLSRMFLPRKSFLIAAATCWLLAFAPSHGQDPETPEPPVQPDIRSLQSDWWAYFEADPATVATRTDEFLAGLEQQIPVLAASNQDLARSVLDSVRDNLEVYAELRGDSPVPAPVATEPQLSYTIAELLDIAAEAREARTLAAAEALEVEREQRTLDGAAQRRDALFKDYLEAEQGDDTWLTGLRLIRARSAQEISERRLELLTETYEAARRNVDLAEERLETAISRLATLADAESLAELIADVAEREADVQSAEEKQRQAQLAASGLELDTIEGRSEQRLQQQQLLAAEIVLASARVALARAEAIRWWTELQIDTGTEYSDVESHALAWSELDREISTRLPEWTRIAEDELLAVQSIDRDGLGRQARRLLDQRLGTAQSTLANLARLDASLADVTLLIRVVDEAIAEQSGTLRSWWSTVKRALGTAWLRVTDLAGETLFSISETPVTGGDILRALIIVLGAFLLSRGVRLLMQRLAPDRSVGTTASLYTISRLTHYTIIILAAFIALTSIGLDFGKLALVAGALSVGIGFGLQSIVNNFVSGLIILFERSLRVGDYIELDTGLTGTVKAINVRSTLINTNDNIDIVVPNSEFVSTRLTNWTLGERILRVRIPFGVAYGSDKEMVRKAAMEAAQEVPYTLTHMPGREPDIWLVEYGDNSLNFLLLVWVNRQGARRPTRTRAAYLWELETKLREYGIEIPFPQRDLHLRSGWPGQPADAVAKPSAEPAQTDEEQDS